MQFTTFGKSRNIPDTSKTMYCIYMYILYKSKLDYPIPQRNIAHAIKSKYHCCYYFQKRVYTPYLVLTSYSQVNNNKQRTLTFYLGFGLYMYIRLRRTCSTHTRILFLLRIYSTYTFSNHMDVVLSLWLPMRRVQGLGQLRLFSYEIIRHVSVTSFCYSASITHNICKFL